ncbi:MAG: hypothetical protein F4Y04_07365 [Chloroflexi bacterium]|nr:hypothetical protein [Chloroflexota bacterium]
MREVLGAIIKPMARLSLAAALALVAIAAIQPLFSDTGDLLAAEAVPAQTEISMPQQAEPDEGGTGVNNFDREEWYEFSILLAPFIVLVTFILILMFAWDRSTGNED